MRFKSGWERFWYAPEPAATLALLRIAVGAVTLGWALSYGSDLATFNAPGGIAPGGSAPYGAVHVGLIVAALCLLVGYRSRLAAVVAFGCLAWLHGVDPWALNSGDALLRDVTFLLALAPSGACLSVDAALRNRGRSSAMPYVSPWALRLVQVQVSAMYVVAAASKLSGSSWRDGTAASYPLRIPTMTRVHLPDQITASPLIVHVLTWGVVGAELAIGLLVWNRRARPWVLGIGVLLHLGIEVTLRAGFFSWIVLASYVAFVPPERASGLVARWAGRSGSLDTHRLAGEVEAAVGPDLAPVRIEGAEGRAP